MFSPCGGSSISGTTKLRALGTTVMPCCSAVSAIVFSATQRPEKRDMAIPARPRSIMSATSAGCRTGMLTLSKMPSVLCGKTEEWATWSSPETASTPPCLEVPIVLAQRNASPLRSTPGPLPYHMPNTPSTRLPGKRSICWAPHSMVAARSSFRPGWKRIPASVSSFSRRHISLIDAAERRAAIAGDQAAGVQPGLAVEPGCSSSTRTSAWMPDSRTGRSRSMSRLSSVTGWGARPISIGVLLIYRS